MHVALAADDAFM